MVVFAAILFEIAFWGMYFMADGIWSNVLTVMISIASAVISALIAAHATIKAAKMTQDKQAALDSQAIKNIDGTTQKTQGAVQTVKNAVRTVSGQATAISKQAEKIDAEINPAVHDIDMRTAQHSGQLKEIVDDLHERRGQEKRIGNESTDAAKLISANTKVMLDKIDALMQENNQLRERVNSLQKELDLCRGQTHNPSRHTNRDDLEL